MKILGVSGGTKNGANDALTKEALFGAQEMGADIEFVHLLDLNIRPCTGCCLCVTGKTGALQGGNAKCVIRNDDFAWLEDKMYEADGLVFSMPIFIKGIPSVFECISDRCGPAHNLARLELAREIREARGVTDVEGPDPRAWKKRVATYFNVGASDWVKRAASDCELFGQLPGIKTIDNITFDWAKVILMDDDRIQRVRQVGRDLALAAKDPENAQYLGDPGVCPHCHSRLFYFGPDGKVSCLVCDIEGALVFQDGRWEFSFDPQQLVRAHDTPSGKRLHAEDVRVIEGKLAEARPTAAYRERVEKYKSALQPVLPPK